MIIVKKPVTGDLQKIDEILSQWTEKAEVNKYIKRIGNEIEGRTEFNMQFWVAKDEDVVAGIVGLSDPMPNIVQFAKTTKPVEIKIMYVDGEHQGRGVGKKLITFMEQEAKRMGFEEVMSRSAKRYKFTAWGFYKKMGYNEVGELLGKDGTEIMQVFSKNL